MMRRLQFPGATAANVGRGSLCVMGLVVIPCGAGSTGLQAVFQKEQRFRGGQLILKGGRRMLHYSLFLLLLFLTIPPMRRINFRELLKLFSVAVFFYLFFIISREILIQII